MTESSPGDMIRQIRKAKKVTTKIEAVVCQ